MDTLSPLERSERMGRVRSKDTKPELAVRRLVHSLGYRYRLHRTNLPGRPDLVFSSRGKVIFVHGCYWHRHEGCARTRLPKSRLDFWRPKLEANVARDATTLKKLRALGWGVMVIWECQVKKRETLASRIKRFLQ
jgi:DNA mismatch endonuclease, patch repair protein